GVRLSAPQLGAEPRSGSRTAPVRTSAAQHGGRSRGGKGGLVAGLVGLVVVGGGVGGYFLYQQQQESARRNAGPPPAPAIPDAVQAVLPRWKLKYLEISGTSAERLTQGSSSSPATSASATRRRRSPSSRRCCWTRRATPPSPATCRRWPWGAARAWTTPRSRKRARC
ncbi:hypothetical protein ACLEPN_42615, partial [Myxococcus sp. 1LA]